MKQLYCIEFHQGNRKVSTKYYQTKAAFDKAWKLHSKYTEHMRSSFGFDNVILGFQLTITNETLMQTTP